MHRIHLENFQTKLQPQHWLRPKHHSGEGTNETTVAIPKSESENGLQEMAETLHSSWVFLPRMWNRDGQTRSTNAQITGLTPNELRITMSPARRPILPMQCGMAGCRFTRDNSLRWSVPRSETSDSEHEQSDSTNSDVDSSSYPGRCL
jgi:hypothetical protein